MKRILPIALTASILFYIIIATLALTSCTKSTGTGSQTNTAEGPKGKTRDTRCFDADGLQIPCPPAQH